ncbi:MAG: ABC transporter permease [Planctomycetes bacterium]|nr:ABC transporter permease [Planctomycetota bacterium]
MSARRGWLVARPGLGRTLGFLRKETLQIVRDPSSIALALVMPVVLTFLFGYGVSLDAEDVPIAVVLEDPGDAARDLVASLQGSPQFEVVRADSMPAAERLVREHRAEAVLRIRRELGEGLAAGGPAPVQLLLDGVDSNRARLIGSYVDAAIGRAAAIRRLRGEAPGVPLVTAVPRTWFNPALRSTHFLVPGLVALVMTLTGILLTALVVAREWERGTMEAVLVTPLRPGEFLLAKLLPYYALGMGGMLLASGIGVTVFGVPLRGSFAALFAISSLFLLASLGLGLVISSSVRQQFVAAQASILAGFLPAFFLSGLLFDLGSTPPAIRVISHVVPARWFVEASHTLFMAGDIGAVLWRDAGVLALMAFVLLAIARRKTTTRLAEDRA